MSEVYEGEVKWFSNGRGYGFITPDDAPETEHFVHFSSILIDGFKTLKPNQRVKFQLKETAKGIQAVEVQPVD